MMLLLNTLERLTRPGCQRVGACVASYKPVYHALAGCMRQQQAAQEITDRCSMW